jgi:hypothetical protein
MANQEKETAIFTCNRCGLLARHEWQRWERKSLLLRITGRTQLMEGWVCTKCGRRRSARRASR